MTSVRFEESIRRIFFHELGHYVAKEINAMNGQGTGTRELWIRLNSNNPGQFEGGTEANVPQGALPGQVVPRSRLAEHIATLVYGCFFQSYRGSHSIAHCFDRYARHDATLRMNTLTAHGFGADLEVFSAIDDGFFTDLVSGRLLDPFLGIEPEGILVSEGSGGLSADLNRLQSASREAIEAHVPIFQLLIDRYNVLMKTLENEENQID